MSKTETPAPALSKATLLKPAGELWAHEFIVERKIPNAVFPFRLLASENCRPKMPADADTIAVTINGADLAQGTRVSLVAYRTHNQFLVSDAWAQAGWPPIEIVKAGTAAPDGPVMVPVKSSNIHSIGYAAERGVMRIRFLDTKGGPGSLYEYLSVPREVWDGLRVTDSKGAYFARHIKPLPYTKLA